MEQNANGIRNKRQQKMMLGKEKGEKGDKEKRPEREELVSDGPGIKESKNNSFRCRNGKC